MTYFVTGADGNEYGPADFNTLVQWAREGRILPDTFIRSETGTLMRASSMPGLFGQTPPTTGPTPIQQQPYVNYPRQGYGPMVPSKDGGKSDVTLAWVLGGIGLLTCFLLSAVGLYFASKAKEKGHPNAQAAFIFCIVVIVGKLLWFIIGLGMAFS